MTCDLNLCYFLGNSLSVGGESFDVCCNKSLLHFSQLSIDFTFFKVVQSFVLCSLGIIWNFVPLNKFDIYSGFSCDSGSLSWYGSPLQITYKNFLSFKMYVDYAYTKNLNNQLVRGKEVVALFNFALWFDLLFSFKFFSICGYISLYEDSFAVQIYTFMQLKLVNTNVLCIYSKFNVKEMRLYYWIILDRDYSLLTKLQSQDKNFHVISVETSMNCISFSSTKSFIQTNMSYTPLDSELRFSYSDPDMACYYIGIYNYDYSLYTRLYRMVFYPLFYAYEDAFYTIGVCAYDTRFFIEDSYTGNFPTAEILEKTGIDLNVYIWFFTNEALDAKVFRFYPKIVN